jgi:hypothetical protein
VDLIVGNRRSLAELIVAPAGKPLTVKRRKACLALPLPPTIETLLDVP